MVCTFLLTSGLSGWCREVNFRLVDAKYIAPVEFWQKNQDIPNGIIYYRFPTTVFVDGQAIEYAAYGGDNDADKITDNQLVPEPKVDSDRMQAIVSDVGVKALVTTEVDEGNHLILPGELKFSVNEEGIETTEPALLKKSAITCYLLCQPIDINLLQGINGPGKINVTVISGDKEIFKESFNANKPAVLRLFLPVSSAGYTIVTDKLGKLRVSVTKDGVKVLTTQNDVMTEASGFTVVLRQGDPNAAETTALLDVPAGNELYLFTDRNREVYMEGERIQFSLRAWGNIVKTGKAEVWLEGGKAPLPLGNLTLGKSGDGAFAEAEIDTSLIRPGKYKLLVKSGEITGNPLAIEIAPLLAETNMKIFTHLKWGDASMNPDDLEKIPNLGFNWLSNAIGTYHGANVMNPGANIFESWQGMKKDPELFKKYQGQHFPPELSEGRARVSSGMESMLSRGVQFLSIHNGLILYFNVGDDWRDQADDRYQTSSHMAMQLRRYPNFGGFTYCTGDGPTPATMGSVWGSAGVASFDVLHPERLKRLRTVFESKFGKIDVDLKDTEKTNEMTDKERAEREKFGLAWGFKVGEDIKMKVSGDEDKAMLWGQWVNDLYPDNFRNLRAILNKTTRNPLLSCGSSWGIGAGGGIYPGTFYRALDFSLNDLHGDYGVCPLNEMTGSDIMSMGMEDQGARPWVGIDMGTQRKKENGFKVYLQSLSRNPSGIGVLDISNGDWVCGWAKDKQKSEDLTLLTDISKRFGDLYSNIDRADEIAIISSLRQEVLGGQPFRALWAAHYLTQKSGYQANIVTDAYCAKHPDELAKRFRAIFLFRMTKALSPGFKAALDSYTKAGGVIITDNGTTVDIKGAIKLPFVVPDSHGPSNTNDHLEFEEFFLPFIKQFRNTVSAAITPYFSFVSQRKTYHNEINWCGIRSRSGDFEYWIIYNDGKPKIEDGVGSQFLYEPDIATVITNNGDGTLYDALRRSVVPTEKIDKHMQFTCDGLKYAGSIYLLSPRPIKFLSVAMSPIIRQGQSGTLRARALDTKGMAFAGLLPIEIMVTDPNGAVRYQLYRTTDSVINMKFAINDPLGIWKWRVQDQATGLVTTGTFNLTASDIKPQMVNRKNNVDDVDALFTFLKRPVTVVITPEEVQLKSQADYLVNELKKKGVNATLKILWPSDTVNYPMQWAYKTMEDKEIHTAVLNGDLLGSRVSGKNHLGDFRKDNFGSYAYYGHYTGSTKLLYYRDIILLGRDDVTPGVLVNIVIRSRMLLRNPSASYPATGQGMIGYACGAFQAQYDTVMLYGKGRDGLDNAIADLIEIAGNKVAPSGRYIPPMSRTAPENGDAYKEMGITTAVNPFEKESDIREVASLLPPTFTTEIAETIATADGKVIVRQDDNTAKGIINRYTVIDDKNITSYIAPTDLKPVKAEAMAWYLGTGQQKRWHAQNVISVGDDYISPAEFGIGRFHADGRPVWFYDPFPLFNNYNEAKYPRRVREYAVSKDGSTILASFYSKTPWPEGSYQQNRSDVVMLDAVTGKPYNVIKGYYGSKLLLAKNGSRGAVADLMHSEPGEHNMREIQNPHDTTGVALFDRAGNELFFIPLSRTADTFAVDDALTMAIVTYSDASRRVSIVDFEKGLSFDYRYNRADFGTVVAADGSFAIVTYTDGTVTRLSRDGTPVWSTKLPLAGKPIIMVKDNTIGVASADGNLQLLDMQGKILNPKKIISANEIALTVKSDPLPPVLEAPITTQWWDMPQGDMKVTPQETALVLPETLTGEYSVKVMQPKLGKMQTMLVSFTYKLNNVDDRLQVSATSGKQTITYPFDGVLLPHPVTVPLRFANEGEVTLTFKCKDGATLSNAKLLLVDAGSWHNAAATKEDLPPVSAPSIKLMVPNVFGLIGDPRAEQVASGLKETKLYNVVDNNIFTGTSLYDMQFPQNHPWFAGTEQNLRSAFILFEYKKPRSLFGLGLWSMPGDLPIEAWTLECCDGYKEEKQMTHELQGNWKIVATGRGNYQPYSVQTFKPTKAKIWRFTITRTPAKMQNLAEIELYEDIMDTIGEDDEDIAGDL